MNCFDDITGPAPTTGSKSGCDERAARPPRAHRSSVDAERVDAAGSNDPAAHASDEAFRPARVKFYDENRGYGFVNVYGRDSDVFVHAKTLRAGGLLTLSAGEAVVVATRTTPRGESAMAVRGWNHASGTQAVRSARGSLRDLAPDFRSSGP